MGKAVLDFTDCKYLLEMHERIAAALQFPAYYGRNWDAFWDSLIYESPVDYVEICGEHTMAENLRPSLDKMHEILEKVKQRRKELGWQFDYKIID